MKSGDEAVAKDIAMHVAAINPARVSAAEVPADEVAQGTRDLQLEQAKSDPKNAGKPQEIVDKIVEGKVRKWLNEITLLGQPFVKDDRAVRRAVSEAGRRRSRLVRALRGRRRHREEAGRFRGRSDEAGREHEVADAGGTDALIAIELRTPPRRGSL